MIPIILSVLCLAVALWITRPRRRWAQPPIRRRDCDVFARAIQRCDDIAAAAKEGR